MTSTSNILISKTPGKRCHYTIDMGAHGRATLQYQSYFNKNAVGSVNDEEWKFTRKGFWYNNLEIVAQQSPYTKTHIKFGWRHELTLRGPDNNTYTFKCNSWWRSRWVWLDSTGQTIMEIKSNPFSRSRRGLVTGHQRWTPLLSWLLLVGLFQLIIWEQQVAAAT